MVSPKAAQKGKTRRALKTAVQTTVKMGGAILIGFLDIGSYLNEGYLNESYWTIAKGQSKGQ